ncbi:hypothetical protein BCV69DRAFT_281884 [Microstroma glucosiphilum]|uniref:Autophagy-related protein 14 n=1 Tax=Pseudomicrostroma glucosiphilum TaxID=1684307 RepID=A0A316U9N8_9BASI|nr:hypothetical protein BCV69DRAFT_281884 [Pseudomicrostroma glucosiphilum]PWN21977.1 hypothetical protein BCV69DRAFT_281884 [Pseudomicrostroma glucosiphilum]
MPLHRQEEASSSPSYPSLSDLRQPTSNRRVRHLASLHLRNFRPGSVSSSDDAQDLFDISLGIDTVEGRIPQYLTEPSQPCVNADWNVDPRYFDTGESSSSSGWPETSSLGVLGRQFFNISAWARNATQAEDGEAAGWSFCWQRAIDLRTLERIPTGLSSPVMRRLPANSLILGLRPSIWGSARIPSEDRTLKAVAGNLLQDNASGSGSGPLPGKSNGKITGRSVDPVELHVSAPELDSLTYYLVPQAVVRKASGKARRESLTSGIKERDESHDEDEGGGSDPEVGGLGRQSPDELDIDGGYDSETAFELSSSASPRKPGRPRLEHRTSSSRTVRALKKGRRKRTSSMTPEVPAITDSPAGKAGTRGSSELERKGSVSSKISAEDERKRRIQSWQLEREREQEVLERSKRETRMLKSYRRDDLYKVLQLLLQDADESSSLAREREAYGRLLTATSGVPALTRRAFAIRGKLSAIEHTLSTQNDSIRQLRSTIAEKRDAFARRRARLDFVKRQLQSDTAKVQASQEEPDHLRRSIARQGVLTHNRRTQLLETLSEIYPIRLISPSDLLLSICDIPLPNSPALALVESRSRVDEEGIAAALGLTAQLVLLLSSYLDTSVHYEIAAAGSRAMIRDGISLMNGPRGFPLYSKGAEPYRFEYAVFLLNKNIEQLMNVHNLPVLDLRHTLPNLNNLMLTLSSPITLGETSTSGPAAPTHRSTSTTIPTTGARIVSQPLTSVRRGYRTMGKGEIVLPTLPAAVTGKDSGLNGVSGGTESKVLASTNGHSHGHDAAKDTPAALHAGSGSEMGRSAAASWTASLLGWSGGKGGSGGAGVGADGYAQRAGASAQHGKGADETTKRRVTSDGTAASADG